MTTRPSRILSPAAQGLAIAVMTLVAYVPALYGDFLWDDDNYVTANAVLRDLTGLWRIWFEPRSTPQYYPLTFTSLWVEYQLWGLRPFGFHVTNVLLHAANALLFWRILLALGVPGAWFAGALFALHPIHVESVAWITERKNVLSGLCYLGSALAYLRFSLAEAPRRRTEWSWYALSLILFVGALASKTVTSTLPAALVLVLWWHRGKPLARDLAALAPFFALGIAGGMITIGLERHHVGAMGPEWDFTLVERCLIAGRILWFYLGTLAWPSDLMFIYPRWEIDAASAWQYVFPLTAAAGVAALLRLHRRIGAGPLTAVLFYAGTLVPALGFFNVYPMRYAFVADHFAYLASLGPIALGAALAVRGLDRIAIRIPIRVALAVLVLAGLGFSTWKQGHIYADEETLWTDTVARNPRGWLGRVHLGRILADSGRLDEATAHLRVAAQNAPFAPEPFNALGAILELQGRLPEAEAAFREALRLEPHNFEVHTNLGIVLAARGIHQEALAHFGTALRLQSEYVEAHYRGAVALQMLGRSVPSARAFAATLLLDPHHAEAHHGLCRLMIDDGRFRDAENHCREAIRLEPDFPEAFESLGRALREQGRADEAQPSIEAAARLRRSLADAHLDQGLRLSREGRPKAALAHLDEVLRLRPDDADAIEARADILTSLR